MCNNSKFCLQTASTCLCRHPVHGAQICMQSKYPCSKTTSLKTAHSPAIPRHKNLITTPRHPALLWLLIFVPVPRLFSEMPFSPSRTTNARSPFFRNASSTVLKDLLPLYTMIIKFITSSTPYLSANHLCNVRS